jgi:hypothetical protein
MRLTFLREVLSPRKGGKSQGETYDARPRQKGRWDFRFEYLNNRRKNVWRAPDMLGYERRRGCFSGPFSAIRRHRLQKRHNLGHPFGSRPRGLSRQAPG